MNGEQPMKHLALLTTAAFLATLLSGCGDKAEKKLETRTETKVEQTRSSEPAKTQESAGAVKPANAGSESTAPKEETARPADKAPVQPAE